MIFGIVNWQVLWRMLSFNPLAFVIVIVLTTQVSFAARNDWFIILQTLEGTNYSRAVSELRLDAEDRKALEAIVEDSSSDWKSRLLAKILITRREQPQVFVEFDKFLE